LRRIKLLGVGINAYKHLRTLSCCVNDVAVFTDEFTKKASHTEATLLVSGRSEDETLTAVRLTEALETFSDAHLAANDLAIFYFAGHGYAFDGKDYLATFDTTATGVPIGINTEDVLEALNRSGAGTSIMFIDACRANFGREIEYFGERTAESARRRGKMAFFSCWPGEISNELPALGHGVFSYALITALRQNVSTTALELEKFIFANVNGLCARNNLGRQRAYAVVVPTENALLNIIDGRYKEIAGPRRRNMIVIAGPSNAGKTMLGQSLSTLLNYTHVEMSSSVWKTASNYPEYNGNIQEFMEQIVWRERTLDCVAQDVLGASSALDNVIVCGARRTEEVDALFASDWKIIPFYLYTSSTDRFRRYRKMVQDRFHLSYSDFVKKDLREYSWGLAAIAHMDGFEFVLNDAEPDALVTQILRRLRSFDIRPGE